jgi:hypothetical protein
MAALLFRIGTLALLPVGRPDPGVFSLCEIVQNRAFLCM